MKAGATMLRTGRWQPSRIGLRLLAFNLLVVFVPVIGVLYLDVYEERLLQTQERAMVQQARVLAAAMGDAPSLDVEALRRAFARFGRRGDARLRVYDSQGMLVADSAREPPAPEEAVRDEDPPYPDDGGIRQRALYRIGVWLVAARDRLESAVRSWTASREEDGAAVAGRADGIEPEVGAALAGRYGAATRLTPGQRSLTLYSAVPIRHDGGVIGAVVVSQSTFRILQALYDVRLRIFEIVVASALAAALLTTIAAMTIVRPLKQLRRQAAALAERRGPLPDVFPGAGRRDELGDLARALGNLTRRLDDHIRLLESFAADVSHEFKNPLASIRTAAEMMAQCEDASDRERFLGLMVRDVDRLERLVSGVRELARIDAQIEHDRLEPVHVSAVLQELADGLALAMPASPPIHVHGADVPCIVDASRERLVQVFENILSNALSLAPAGSVVEVTLAQTDRTCSVSIADSGPGIPDAHLNRIFERFFSYRPGRDRRDHVGLGLAIARAIVDGYGGALEARNRPAGGAEFTVRLPLSSRSAGAAAPREVTTAVRGAEDAR